MEVVKTITKKRCVLIPSQTAVTMLVVQLVATGLQLLSKMVLHNGTFVFALMTYRNIVAALCVSPLALFFEREMNRNMITWTVLLYLFLNALFGITAGLAMFYYGLRDTSASYATNFTNLIPILTFILSIILRVERLRLGTRYGKVKTIGAILCFAGVLTTGLYKGKTFFLTHHGVHEDHTTKTLHSNWIRGSILLFGSCLSYAIWFVFQVSVSKHFPLRYYTTVFTCIMGSIQSATVGLFLDRSKESWGLKWDLQLATIVYSGALATTANFCLNSWVIKKRGPTYPAMFTPLSLIFVIILESIIFATPISAGMLVGAMFIMSGLGFFFFGKRQETLSNSNEVSASSLTRQPVTPSSNV